MNFKELLEGAEPKLPGAPKGISIMTPQQFVASAGDMPDEEVEEGRFTHGPGGVPLDRLGNPKVAKPAMPKLSRMSAPEPKLDLDKIWFDVTQIISNIFPDGDPADYLPKYARKHGITYDDIRAAAKKNGYEDEYAYIDDMKTGDYGYDEQGLAESLDEAVGGNYLYHATGRAGLKGILASGSILKAGGPQPATQAQTSIPTVSVTRDWGYASGSNATTQDNGINRSAVLVLDRNAIESNFKTLGTSQSRDIRGLPRSSEPELAGKLRARAIAMRQPELKGQNKQNFGTSKAGGEFEEVVVVPKGALPLKGIMVGFWVNPKSELMQDTTIMNDPRRLDMVRPNQFVKAAQPQAVAECEKQLDRIRKLSGLSEATELPASQRAFGGQEFQDYMGRIIGDPVTDPETGEVKRGPDVVSKKTGEIKPGPEKYVSGKLKTDRYKLPYIHRSSVIEYMGPDGKTFDEEAVKRDLSVRPKALLKQNEKMKHSNGEFEQFFNIGFAALIGIAVDESTNNLIIVNTCPGAGSCKVECFAMKGGKVQFKGPWLSDGRILTYLLNNPNSFFDQLSNEISVEEQLGAKGDKEYTNGWKVTVRWHDAGDFFSPEYLDMALKMAAKHPTVNFYAYTKMAGAALAKKPDNFIINWSEGASSAQEKQIKAQDPNLEKTKNSRIVPKELFYGLLAKDEKGNLSKGPEGQWRPSSPEALVTMKDRLAKEYNISTSSILSYNEYLDKIVNKQWKIWLADNNIDMETLRSTLAPHLYDEKVKELKNSFIEDKKAGKVAPVTPLKFNVIVAPGEGDISANDPVVLSTLLLKH